MPRLARDTRGSSAIEFVMIAPLLFMLILGGFQISRAMQARGALREAVGAAGRAAVVAYHDTSDGVLTESQVSDLVRTKAIDQGHRLQTASLTVTTTIADDSTLEAKKITISASYIYRLTLPLLSNRNFTFTQSRIFYAPS